MATERVSRRKAPALTGLEGVALEVGDLAKAVAFYRDVLGLKVEVMAPGHFAMVPKLQLGLLSTGKKVRSQGFHLEIEVEDVDAWYVYLRDRGVEVSAPVTEEWGERNVYFTDPDGHEIELSQGS